jgi:hypothetical protein
MRCIILLIGVTFGIGVNAFSNFDDIAHLITELNPNTTEFNADSCLAKKDLTAIEKFTKLHLFPDGKSEHYTAYLAIKKHLIHLHIMNAGAKNVFTKTFNPSAYLQKVKLDKPSVTTQGENLFCTYSDENGIVVQSQMWVGRTD